MTESYFADKAVLKQEKRIKEKLILLDDLSMRFLGYKYKRQNGIEYDVNEYERQKDMIEKEANEMIEFTKENGIVKDSIINGKKVIEGQLLNFTFTYFIETKIFFYLKNKKK